MQPSLLATELTVNCIVQSPSLSSLINMRQSSILVGLPECLGAQKILS